MLCTVLHCTGIMYHHNRGYMKRMREKKVQPYGFHM